jgi:hypothetical protein
MLAMPGTCPANLATTDNCGHIHVYVDDMACTPSGSPYNNDAEMSPAIAILSSCPMANGAHTVTLELHHDNHMPVIDTSTNMTISASVMVTASGG